MPEVPTDTESEEMVVAAALSTNGYQLAECAEILAPHHFWDQRWRWCWDVALGLWSEGQEVNQVTVAYELSKRRGEHQSQLDEVGGQLQLTDSIRKLPAADGARWYAERIVNSWGLRTLYHKMHLLMLKANTPNAEAMALAEELAEAGLSLQIRPRALTQSVAQVLRGGLMVEVEQWMDDPKLIRGLSTGWRRLDHIIDGLMPTRLHVLKAHTSQGKSLFTQNIARHVANNGTPVLLFTTEMGRSEVTERFLFMEAGMDRQTRRIEGEVTTEQRMRVRDAGLRLEEAPIWVCDFGSLTLAMIRTEVRRRKLSNNVGLVIVDHLQMVAAPGTSRVEQTAAVTSGLKALSQDENLPIIAISHVARDPSGALRGKWSGSIEEDANVLMEMTAVKFEGEWKDLTERDAQDWMRRHGFLNVRINVTKNRSGMRGAVILRMQWRDGGRFYEVKEDEE